MFSAAHDPPHLIFAASDAVVVVCPVVQQDYVLRARLDTPQFHGLACAIIRKNLCLRIVQSDQIARDFGFPGDGSKIEIGVKPSATTRWKKFLEFIIILGLLDGAGTSLDTFFPSPERMIPAPLPRADSIPREWESADLVWFPRIPGNG